VLRLYDTRLRDVVPVTGEPGTTLRIYACGPTVYKPQHVGNLRSSVLPDLISRVAQYDGQQVTYVQNVTDVGHLNEESGEDKIIAEATARGLSPLQIAREIEALFHSDGRALGLQPAFANPRASDYIPQMITMTATLLEKGHAYEAGGSVWFDARSYPGYGALSGNRLGDVEAGASGRLSSAEAGAKRFHADWALWRGGADDFDSPWGTGSPGWHLECSAMSLELLGTGIDVHTGGIDLRFPHHEGERAQGAAVTGVEEVVKHWVHGEHLLFEGRKMSKSTGNVVLLSDVVAAGHDPLAVRLFFLQAGRYRTQLDMTWAQIAAADRRLARWREQVAAWAREPGAPMPLDRVTTIADAFRDDLDTVRATVLLNELARDTLVPAGSRFEAFARLDRLFGLDLVRDVGRAPALLPPGAADLLAAREAARAAKDYPASDWLREELAALGVKVTDSQTGQAWSVAT
jgi:cysteinyl-tRNA synthetase